MELDEQCKELKSKHDEAAGQVEAAGHVKNIRGDGIEAGVKASADKQEYARQYAEKVSEHNNFATQIGYNHISNEIVDEIDSKIASQQEMIYLIMVILLRFHH